VQAVIEKNLQEVRTRIAAACRRVGRKADEVTIIAVTKTHGPAVVEAAIAAGVADIGENRVQEFIEKRSQVQRPCRWHLIGTLQRNKATKAIGEFEMIHSVDRVKLAETLQRLGSTRDLTTRVLLEVNTSGEATKHGFDAGEVIAAARAVAAMDHLQLEGLMTLGPLTEDATRIRRAFQSLFRLREKIELDLGRALPHLSMGMSGDYEIAVEEGATMVRVGRVLFGARGA
jgi:pyridoxal phosphate enzyme (YggS family)